MEIIGDLISPINPPPDLWGLIVSLHYPLIPLNPKPILTDTFRTWVIVLDFKVVPGGYHKYFFGVKVKTVKFIGGTRFLAARSGLKAAIYACPNHTDDGIYSYHGYLDTLDIPLGPP